MDLEAEQQDHLATCFYVLKSFSVSVLSLVKYV
jgi:hypothetical protein